MSRRQRLVNKLEALDAEFKGICERGLQGSAQYHRCFDQHAAVKRLIEGCEAHEIIAERDKHREHIQESGW